MIRFFLEHEYICRDEVTLHGSSCHYLKRVLRVEKGMEVNAFDGSGREYKFRVVDAGADWVKLAAAGSRQTQNELPVSVTLALGVSKPKSFEFALQKTAELGVKKIIPLICRRSRSFVSSSKYSRWRKILSESSRQSARSFIPELAFAEDFSYVAAGSRDYGVSIMPWEEEENVKIGQILSGGSYNDVLLMIGPEGGFCSSEAREASERGILTVSLGPRILRAETAAAACLAMLSYRFELGG